MHQEHLRYQCHWTPSGSVGTEELDAIGYNEMQWMKLGVTGQRYVLVVCCSLTGVLGTTTAEFNVADCSSWLFGSTKQPITPSPTGKIPRLALEPGLVDRSAGCTQFATDDVVIRGSRPAIAT